MKDVRFSRTLGNVGGRIAALSRKQECGNDTAEATGCQGLGFRIQSVAGVFPTVQP